MKILIADSFPDSHAQILEENGHALTIDANLDGESLTEAIKDSEALIVRSTKVTAATMDAAPNLKLIIRAGAGTNTIDKLHAAKKQIRVCNVPGANAVAVAELVMGLILSIDRQLPQNVSDLQNNVWNKKKYSKAQGLYGQKIAILGLGAIGFAVATRAKAFGMDVYALSKPGRSVEAEQKIANAGITQLESLNALLQTCDIVSLHMPATAETTSMVNQDFLANMQPGAILINSSRGELVDEAALIEAMDSHGIRAGLDVYNNEPGAGDNRFFSALAGHPNVCGTHHIGASTNQAQIAVSDGVLNVIQSYLDNDLINCVN